MYGIGEKYLLEAEKKVGTVCIQLGYAYFWGSFCKSQREDRGHENSKRGTQKNTASSFAVSFVWCCVVTHVTRSLQESGSNVETRAFDKATRSAMFCCDVCRPCPAADIRAKLCSAQVSRWRPYIVSGQQDSSVHYYYYYYFRLVFLVVTLKKKRAEVI